MKQTSLLIICVLCCTLFQHISAQIIITQYYEGGGYNKWIELTNIGNSSVDLTSYKMAMWSRTSSDGSKIVYDGDPDKTAQLSGTLESGKSVLIGRDNNDGEVGYITDYLNFSNVTNFNGNDGIALLDADDNIIDRFCDSISAKDDAYIRNDDIQQPNPKSSESEWTKIDIETVQNATAELPEYLGFHAVVSVPKKISAQIEEPVDTFFTTETISVTWEALGAIDSIKLFAQPIDDSTDSVFLAQLSAADERFSMVIADSVKTGKYHFIVTDSNDATCYAITDTAFILKVSYPAIREVNNLLAVTPGHNSDTVSSEVISRLSGNFDGYVNKNKGDIRILGCESSMVTDGIFSLHTKFDTIAIDVLSDKIELTGLEAGKFNALIITIDEDLKPNYNYYVEIDSGAFVNEYGLPFQGLTKESEPNWMFVTKPVINTIAIADLQDYTGNSDGSSCCTDNNELYKIKGVVTFKNEYHYLIQDSELPLSGISFGYIRGPELGDSVTIIGRISEYNQQTEITTRNIEINSGEGMSIKHAKISLDDVGEDYESMIIELNDLKVSDITDSTFQVTNGDLSLNVNTCLCNNLSINKDDNVISLRGALLQEGEDFILYPQSENDIEVKSAGVNKNEVIELSCNQINHQLIIETANEGSVDIVDITGKSKLKKAIQNKAIIEVSSWKKGIYILIFRGANGENYTQKIFVY